MFCHFVQCVHGMKFSQKRGILKYEGLIYHTTDNKPNELSY